MRMPPTNNLKARLWVARMKAKRARLPWSRYVASSNRAMLKLRMRDRRLYEAVLKRINADVDKLTADLSLPFEEWLKRLLRRARRRAAGRRRPEQR
jgi:hypothetical protein